MYAKLQACAIGILTMVHILREYGILPTDTLRLFVFLCASGSSEKNTTQFLSFAHTSIYNMNIILGIEYAACLEVDFVCARLLSFH